MYPLNHIYSFLFRSYKSHYALDTWGAELAPTYAKVHFGRGTYTNTHLEDNFGIVLESREQPGYVIVRHYCSIGRNVSFLFPRSEKSVSNYPFSAFMEEDEKVGINMLGMRASGDVDMTISVGNDVRIEDSVSILGGVSIGDGAYIRADSFVTEDVPAYAVVSGNPARVSRLRFTSEQIDTLLLLRWWDWDFDFLIHSEFFRLSPEEFFRLHKDTGGQGSRGTRIGVDTETTYFESFYMERYKRSKLVPRPAPKPSSDSES